MKSLRNLAILILGAAALLRLLFMSAALNRFSHEILDADAEAVLAARLDQVTSTLQALDARYRSKAVSLGKQAAVDLRVLVESDGNLRAATLYGRDGAVVASSDASKTLKLDAERLRHVIATGAGEPVIEGGLVRYAAPLLQGGNVAGVAVLDLPIEALQAPLREAAAKGIDVSLRDAVNGTLAMAHGPTPAGREFVASRSVQGTEWVVEGAWSDADTSGRIGRLRRAALLISGLVLALGFAAALLIVNRVLQPLRNLARFAADVSKGKFDARLPEGGNSELDDLAQSFNQMSDALVLARKGMEEKVQERTQALEEAGRRNRELAERSEELARHRYHEQAKGRALAALTADAELDAVVGAALAEMAGPVGAAVMICYRLEGAELVPVASYAASEQARTTAVPLAGMAEQALRKGRIETLEGLAGEIPLRFDCLIAAGTPSALALVPLKVGNRPTGLLAVGALARLQTDAATMLMDLAAPLALTMARRSLLDHTERIARELARRNEELRTQAEALEAQGEELKAQQQELSIKNQEVEKADKLKSEFLANMSHELRTPLNAVIGFSDLLLEDKATLNATQQQWVGDIQESGKHLLMLINRVLDLAKIEAGRTSFHLEALDPADLLAGAQTLVRPSAKKRNIEIGVVESPARAVQGDRGHLHQVLINLLANAVKFSPEGASVQVGFAEETEEPAWPATGGARTRAAPIGQVRFWVTDHGPGIDEETQRRLFEPFFQAESPLVKKHEGTGLGLAISRKLIEGMGGHIGVQSAPGAGSTFFFTLPLAGAQPAQDFTQGAAPPLSYDKEAPLVLVVDDHDLNRQVAREMLERRGCRVILARDGEEGVQRARQDHPRLVLLDLAMPRKDGFAVARELKMDPQTARTPLVALTALAMRGDDERVLQAGFDGYLPKPLERAALDATLARIFAN